jgi:ferredoxin
VRVAHAFTRAESGEGSDLRGHFVPEHLSDLLPGDGTAEAYVCGPQPLVEGVRALWAARGLGERVHSESFVPPAYALPADERGGTIRFDRSGLAAPNSGATLLEQAEQAGLTPEFGCRVGICHTCTCRKRSGRVRDVRSGELSSAEEASIQLCVSVPAGDVELDL